MQAELTWNGDVDEVIAGIRISEDDVGGLASQSLICSFEVLGHEETLAPEDFQGPHVLPSVTGCRIGVRLTADDVSDLIDRFDRRG